MRKSLAILAVALTSLSACGGQTEAQARRPDAAPTVAVLAAPAGTGASDLRAGRADAARSRFEALLNGDPEELGALNDLAVSYALEGRLDAARSLLDEVVAHGGPRAQQVALVNLGELYALEGYLPAALAHLETARSIDPARPEPVFALALLADARGDRVQGAQLVREALRLDEGGAGRQGLAFLHPEERAHLEALLAEARGDRVEAAARWRELRAGRFPALAAAARSRLDE
jgi:Flp pilus assembly protein TadD